MMLSETDRAALDSLLVKVERAVPAGFDAVGVGMWLCHPPVMTRMELHFLRRSRQKVLYAAYGCGGSRPAQGVELMLTHGLHKPEDYTGSYSGVAGDVKLRGVGYGVGLTTSLGPGPKGISLGLSSPGPSWWFCEYRIVGVY